MPLVMIIGSATLDTVETGRKTLYKIGGVTTYAGLTFRSFGYPVCVLASIAKPDLPLFRVYGEHGMRLVNGPTAFTTRFVNRETPSGRVQELPSRADPIRHWNRAAGMARLRHVHLGPLHPDDIDPVVISAVASGAFRVSLDVQGYLRETPGQERGDFRVTPRLSDRLAEALSAAHVIKADGEEFKLMLRTFGTDAAGFRKRFGLEEILVTGGSAGGVLFTSDGNTIRYDAAPVAAVEDATGAGDVFFAAYLAARFHGRRPPVESLADASVIAARHVAGKYLPAGCLEIRTDVNDGYRAAEGFSGRRVENDAG
jgi:hypothetical protein